MGTCRCANSKKEVAQSLPGNRYVHTVLSLHMLCLRVNGEKKGKFAPGCVIFGLLRLRKWVMSIRFPLGLKTMMKLDGDYDGWMDGWMDGWIDG